MASRSGGIPALLLFLVAAGCACWAPSAAAAQAGKPAKSKPATPTRSATPALETGRYLVQVLADEVDLHEGPLATEPVIARAARGTYFEADARAGDWYRVRRARGGQAWILDAVRREDRTITVSPWPGDARLDYGAVAPESEGLERRRPQGTPLEPRLSLIDPARVASPAALALH